MLGFVIGLAVGLAAGWYAKAKWGSFNSLASAAVGEAETLAKKDEKPKS